MSIAEEITCPIADECGGCSLMGVPYAQQLDEKQRRIARLFENLVAHAQAIKPILGMEDPQRYRTKIVSPFAPVKKKRSLRSMARTGRAGKVALRQSEIQCGLYAAGTHRIIECENCLVEHEVGRRVVAAVRQIMARYGMAPYDEDAGEGFVRHVVVRVGARSGEVLVTLVTNDREFTGAKNFCKELVRRVPEVTTVVQNVNTRQTNAIFGQEERVLYGPGFILDTLCGLSFRISSHSFYQVNAVQTEVLYSAALDSAVLTNGGEADAASPAVTQSASDSAGLRTGVRGAPAGETISCTSETLADSSIFGSADLAGDGLAESAVSANVGTQGQEPSLTILDAYCGTGTIGLVAAAAVPGAQVIGVDNVEAAIADARQNAAHNGIDNARFVVQDAGDFMRSCAAQGDAVDVVFMDPPRAGASEAFLDALVKLAPARVVYISCNPETQVRDAAVLVDAGYTIESVQPVDMFPHTPHIENIVSFARA